MPSGRDSFRRNRVAPIGLFYSITGAKIWRVAGIQSLAPRFLSSRMGIVGIHPAVFVRVANKEVTGYGTWKSAQRIENKGFGKGLLRGSGEKIIVEFK